MKTHISNKGNTVNINHICIFPGEDYLFIQIATTEKHPIVDAYCHDGNIIIRFNDMSYNIQDCTILTLIPEYIKEIKIFKDPIMIKESDRGGLNIWVREDALKQCSNMYEATINEI